MEREDHLGDQLINCFQCKEPQKVLELEPHYATCVKANFKCQWCDTIFKVELRSECIVKELNHVSQ